jgi:hypothetical protein
MDVLPQHTERLGIGMTGWLGVRITYPFDAAGFSSLNNYLRAGNGAGLGRSVCCLNGAFDDLATSFCLAAIDEGLQQFRIDTAYGKETMPKAPM